MRAIATVWPEREIMQEVLAVSRTGERAWGRLVYELIKGAREQEEVYFSTRGRGNAQRSTCSGGLRGAVATRGRGWSEVGFQAGADPEPGAQRIGTLLDGVDDQRAE